MITKTAAPTAARLERRSTVDDTTAAGQGQDDTFPCAHCQITKPVDQLKVLTAEDLFPGDINPICLDCIALGPEKRAEQRKEREPKSLTKEEVAAAEEKAIVNALFVPTWLERADVIARTRKKLVHWNQDKFLIFRRGTTLVRIMHDAKTRQPIIDTYDRRSLAAEIPSITEFARGIKVNPKVKDDIKILFCDPPPLVVDALLSQTDRIDLPILDQIVTTPVFAPDGTLIIEPGYSQRGQLWYEPVDGLQMPPVSWNPTRQEIDFAKMMLYDCACYAKGECNAMLGEFPYSGPKDLAHIVSLLLQPFARELISGPTPLYLVEAPSPGSGKSLSVDVIQMVVLGYVPAVSSLPEEEREVKKVITANLLEGPQFIYFDNVRRVIDSNSLSSALTSENYKDRVLGISKNTQSLPNKATWVMTANNPSLSEEMARRCIPIRIASPVERPWERDGFSIKDLRNWTMQNRGLLIWSALTIIQAWIVMGKPLGQRVLGSFESWSKVMGGIVENVLGLDGFLTGLHEFYRKADVESETSFAFLLTWWNVYKNTEVATGALWQLAVQCGILDKNSKSSDMGLYLRGLVNKLNSGLHVEKTKRSTWRLIGAPDQDQL